VDVTQFYFTTMNLLAIYRPMRIGSILPPFGSRAFVAGTQHYMTFDRRFYEFAGECSYLLASDFVRNDFSAVVNYVGAGGKVTRKSVTILSDNRQVEIDSGFRVTLNGRKIEMPLMYESTSIVRDGQRLIVTNSKSGFRVDCNFVPRHLHRTGDGLEFRQDGRPFRRLQQRAGRRFPDAVPPAEI
jgi:hypothetical protein